MSDAIGILILLNRFKPFAAENPSYIFGMQEVYFPF